MHFKLPNLNGITQFCYLYFTSYKWQPMYFIAFVILRDMVFTVYCLNITLQLTYT